MPLAPTVTFAGTSVALANKPSNNGGSIQATYGPNDLNSSANLQGQLTNNPFQELNLVVAEFARTFGTTPLGAMSRISQLLKAMMTQSYF